MVTLFERNVRGPKNSDLLSLYDMHRQNIIKNYFSSQGRVR